MTHQGSAQSPSLVVRKALPADLPALLSLIDGLAAYEKLKPPDAAAKHRLATDLFGERPRIEAYLGEYGGKSAGYAIIFESYSSFLALPSLFLEDIFVLHEYRNKKLGLALFTALVREAFRRGCGRMEWMVLDWNQVGIDFYERIGATHMKQWQLYRLVRSDMENIIHETLADRPAR